MSLEKITQLGKELEKLRKRRMRTEEARRRFLEVTLTIFSDPLAFDIFGKVHEENKDVDVLLRGDSTDFRRDYTSYRVLYDVDPKATTDIFSVNNSMVGGESKRRDVFVYRDEDQSRIQAVDASRRLRSLAGTRYGDEFESLYKYLLPKENDDPYQAFVDRLVAATEPVIEALPKIQDLFPPEDAERYFSAAKNLEAFLKATK